MKQSLIPADSMKGRVRFNEVNLREIEANKPAREKITEPKTPFHPMIPESGCLSPTPDYAGDYDPAALAEAIMNALNKVAQCNAESEHSDGRTSSEDETNSDAENQGPLKETDTRTFKERRTAHYDEYTRVKDLQQKGHFLDNGHYLGTGDSHSDLISKAREISITDGDEIVQTINIKGDD